jgi:hypothetical protein
MSPRMMAITKENMSMMILRKYMKINKITPNNKSIEIMGKEKKKKREKLKVKSITSNMKVTKKRLKWMMQIGGNKEEDM